MLLIPLLLFLSLLISPISAQCTSTRTTTTLPTGTPIIDIQVGLNGLTFTPPIVNAPQGSQLNFHFDPRNHSVAESRFAEPCTYVEGGIWSGYVPTSSGEAENVFSITLNDSNAHWLYCSQASHCQGGMVMVVNPPANSSDTLRAYTAAAQNASQSTAGEGVTGGVIVNSSNSSSSTSTASTGSSTSSATSTASSTSSTVGASTSAGLAVGNRPGWVGVVGGMGVVAGMLL